MKQCLKKQFEIINKNFLLKVLTCLFVLIHVQNPCEQLHAQNKIKVVATTSIIKDAVLNIAKDKIKLDVLMGAGVDPHLYKATHGDLIKLRQADLIIYHGLHLEGKLSEILSKLAKNKPVIAVSDSIPKDLLLFPEDSIGQPDPHIWFDIKLWSEAIKAIATELAKLDASNSSFYLSNYNLYSADLLKLDQEIKARMREIPKESRVLITAHDAFGYFGRAYDIEVKGLQGISTASDFGLYDLNKLVNLVIEKNIKAVFVETSVSEKFIQALISGVTAKGGKVKLGGELFSDALGQEGTKQGSYIGVIRHNVDTIVSALK
jgi:manganese/zinc/iron transport system substrate-binding protein